MLKLLSNQLSAALTSGAGSRRCFFDSKLLAGASAQSGEQQPQQQKSNLFKLRKATGYALNKCKEALEVKNGDLDEATKWLSEQAQKEGWAKAEKVKDRSTAQGTLVLCTDRVSRIMTIVEVNCETDFVARNEKFLDLAAQLAQSVMLNVTLNQSKQLVDKEALSRVAFLDSSSRTIGDQVALSIAGLGENISVRRALLMRADKPGQQLCWYMHSASNIAPINACHFGKYAALVNVSLTSENTNYHLFDLGRQLAQHVVGMKPKTIGEIVSAAGEASGAAAAAAEAATTPKIDENETRFLYQEFLMKPETRVLDFLNEQHLVINDFVRVECGEPGATDQ